MGKGKIIFVVGTHTGIGKTIFSALLAKELNAIYVKPVETGGDFPEDTTLVKRSGALMALNFYHFKNPVSPHIAGNFSVKVILKKIEKILKSESDFEVGENSEVDGGETGFGGEKSEVEKIGIEKGVKERKRKNEVQKEKSGFGGRKILIVESAGGVMTPLRSDYTWLDFAQDLQKIEKTDVIVVAGNYLGVLNHIILTFNALERRGIKPLGFVLNSFERESHISQRLQEEGIKKLRFKFFGEKITNFYLGKIPFIPDIKRKLTSYKSIDEVGEVIKKVKIRIGVVSSD